VEWLSLFLAGVYVIGSIGFIVKIHYIRRRLRHSLAITTGVITSALILVPTLMITGLSAISWAQYIDGIAVITLLGLAVATFLNQRSIYHSEHPKKILAIGAHPDDLELACGGSLARFKDNGHTVNTLVMSHGSQGGEEEIRAGEAIAAAKLLELNDITVYDFTDTVMSTEINAMIKAIEAVIEITNPDIIITHSRNDQHQDHHAVHLATLRAARRCSTILCFESPSVTTDFTAQFFVDIADYMDVKIAAVKKHANQSEKPYIDERKLSGKALHRGEQAKVDYAEGYEVVRALSSQLGSL
jgi:uncharacterized protein, lmbE-like protein